jgi:Dolichyl-phosphate-mannose-protein mannosyltransferase
VGARPRLVAVVAGCSLVNGLLALPITRPRIFGDELIYWELSRSFAWTGHFTVRGGAAPQYGVVYPALLAVAQRIGRDQATAYAIAQGLNAVVFSLTAVPAYAIASRVLTQRHALLAAALTAVVPSCVLTSAIMTENAFYPLFLSSALLMVRALERPSAARQMLVALAVLLTFLTRAQAVLLLPSYLLAAIVLAVIASPGSRLPALVRALRQHAPTLGVLILGSIAALALGGLSTLGPYHVLVTSYSVKPLVRWSLANLADIELYLGVIPLAAFGVMVAVAFRKVAVSAELRRLVILTACLGLGLLATVAVLSASPYGLGRTHERNLFYLAPLVLICFFAWIEAGLPRPRGASLTVAIVLSLLPLTIPLSAIVTSSGEDGLALVAWQDHGVMPARTIHEMVVIAVLATAVFLVSRQATLMIGISIAALSIVLFVGERHAVRGIPTGAAWRDKGWIDRAVGPDAQVVALWTATTSGGQGSRIANVWADEFFNRSVHDVASADGRLPDGLPIERLTVRADGCVQVRFPFRPRYAVVETTKHLTAPVVAVNPWTGSVLYRLDARAPDRACFARVQRH